MSEAIVNNIQVASIANATMTRMINVSSLIETFKSVCCTTKK